MHIIEITDFIDLIKKIPVIDVRSEGEFEQGRIPLATNVPLLNNEERKAVGICYKEKGNEAAVLLGYELVGGKFANIIRRIMQIAPEKKVLLHCWRGGLRSRIVSQLLENAGFEVFFLKGGYKKYRNFVLQSFQSPKNLCVIGGYTGSGKTLLLQKLAEAGEQIIDLEFHANHKGSTFGGIGQPPQPTQEQFENELHAAFTELDFSKKIWIEDESRRIGNVCLPLELWENMRQETLYEIEVLYAHRCNRILEEYSELPIEELTAKTKALKKRLGDKHLNEVLEFLSNGNTKAWAEALLAYYDKNYNYGMSKREILKRHKINLEKNFSSDEFLSQAKVYNDKKGPKPLNEQKL